jgi:hypothetical protein
VKIGYFSYMESHQYITASIDSQETCFTVSENVLKLLLNFWELEGKLIVTHVPQINRTAIGKFSCPDIREKITSPPNTHTHICIHLLRPNPNMSGVRNSVTLLCRAANSDTEIYNCRLKYIFVCAESIFFLSLC